MTDTENPAKKATQWGGFLFFMVVSLKRDARTSGRFL